MASPIGVHLVGSIPLTGTNEVFIRVPAALPNRLFSIPDGETGIRDNLIRWQLPCFPKEALHLEVGGIGLPADHSGNFALKSIAPTKYDEIAVESYMRFVELRSQNIIPRGVRFQVSLPTPFAGIQTTRPEFHACLEPLYERRILESLEVILKSIPPYDLAIQWDVCLEIAALEYDNGRLRKDRFKPYFAPVRQGVIDRIQRICDPIPDEIPIGFHLCYGDQDHKHFIEPDTTETMVDLANGIFDRLKRPVSWLHMPVPRNRYDVEYFEPLKDLQAGEDTRLYLGLVHADDMEGTRRRIRAAQSAIHRAFGVATECGMGRTPREELESIFHISMTVTDTDGKGGGRETQDVV